VTSRRKIASFMGAPRAVVTLARPPQDSSIDTVSWPESERRSAVKDWGKPRTVKAPQLRT